MTVFKIQKIADVIENSQKQGFSHGTRKNLMSKCCPICFLYFETSKMYQRRTCWLCKFDKNHSLRDSLLKKWGKTLEDFEAHLLKRHKELKINKEQLMKARNCTVINPPICERIKGESP